MTEGDNEFYDLCYSRLGDTLLDIINNFSPFDERFWDENYPEKTYKDMKKNRCIASNKVLARSRESLAFGSELINRFSEMAAEIEEYHRLKEHLMIILGTKKRRYTIEHDDAELKYIYNQLDIQLFGSKKDNESNQEG